MKRLEIDTRRGSGRPLLLIVLVVASLVVTTMWYREGTSGPLHSLRTGITAGSQPLVVFGTFVASPFRAAGSWMGGLTVDRSEYERLRRQNTELKQRLAGLEEARLENERIREIVDFAETEDRRTLGARIIGRPTDTRQRTILVDRGASSGVKRGDPVIAAGGLIGQVVEVTPWNARVRLITDSGSGVAVLVQRTRANGIVRGSVDGPLKLEFLDKNALPVKGDVLLTSGLGGTYPKGIVVGEVTDVSSRRADLFPFVTVSSRVDLDRVEEVLLLSGQAPAATQPGGGE